MSDPRGLRRGRVLAHVLDDLFRIPGTRFRIGLDPLVGLVPGLGDWMGWAASLDLMVTAARLRVPVPVMLRMGANTTFDAVVGVVPLAGDLFDAGWKANRRNLELLERYARDPAKTSRSSRVLLWSVLGGTVTVLVGAALGAVLVFRWVLGVVF
jgi:hypothetical protein